MSFFARHVVLKDAEREARDKAYSVKEANWKSIYVENTSYHRNEKKNHFFSNFLLPKWSLKNQKLI